MEAQIQAILDANNMGSEKQIMRAEAEMEAKLDPEEVGKSDFGERGVVVHFNFSD